MVYERQNLSNQSMIRRCRVCRTTPLSQISRGRRGRGGELRGTCIDSKRCSHTAACVTSSITVGIYSAVRKPPDSSSDGDYHTSPCVKSRITVRCHSAAWHPTLSNAAFEIRCLYWWGWVCVISKTQVSSRMPHAQSLGSPKRKGTGNRQAYCQSTDSQAIMQLV